MPETYWDVNHRVLIQRYVEGEQAAFAECYRLALEVKQRGIFPQDLFGKKNVLTDLMGHSWIIDIGHFEKIPRALRRGVND